MIQCTQALCPYTTMVPRVPFLESPNLCKLKGTGNSKSSPFTLLHQQYENYLFVVPEPCRAVFRFGGLQLFMHKMEDTVGCSRRLKLKIDSRNQQNQRKWLLERETTIITGRKLELNVGAVLLKIESHRLW